MGSLLSTLGLGSDSSSSGSSYNSILQCCDGVVDPLTLLAVLGSIIGLTVWLRQAIIDNVKIEHVKDTKFLGVMIDQNLNFSDHIQYIKGKMARGIGILYKCRRLLHEKTMITLYYSFVYPYFTYCILVWGNTFSTYLDGLVKLQKRAIRIICGETKYAHTEPL